MRGFRVLVALFFGAVITLIQFVAVGALNEASLPVIDEVVNRNTAQPLVVTQPPEPIQSLPQRPTQLLARAPKTMAATRRVAASALPALDLSQTHLGLGSVLPDLGEVGGGSMDVSEIPADSDRSARAQRTVEPLYPPAAQRNGVEGYVILRLNIDVMGRVRDVFVVDSEPIGVFERSARDAARRFEFTPARVGGAAVPSVIEKKIVFSLQ